MVCNIIWYIGKDQKCIDISLNNKLSDITDRLLYYVCANDTGGFDFAVIKDKNGNPTLQINLVDMNVTRFTGTCMTLLIADKYNTGVSRL